MNKAGNAAEKATPMDTAIVELRDEHVALEESTETAVDFGGACEVGDGEDFSGLGSRGAGAGAWPPRTPWERSTSLISYTAS